MRRVRLQGVKNPGRSIPFAFSSLAFKKKAYLSNGEMFFLLPSTLMGDPFHLNIDSGE